MINLFVYKCAYGKIFCKSFVDKKIYCIFAV